MGLATTPGNSVSCVGGEMCHHAGSCDGPNTVPGHRARASLTGIATQADRATNHGHVFVFRNQLSYLR